MDRLVNRVYRSRGVRVGRSCRRPQGLFIALCGTPGTAGSRLLPMRNQFQFRAGSPPAMLVAKAARLALRLHGERASQRYLTHAFYMFIQHVRIRI